MGGGVEPNHEGGITDAVYVGREWLYDMISFDMTERLS